jgi:hypothetical protein
MHRPLALLVALLWTGAAYAHKPSDSYLTLRADGPRLDARWDIALRDLDQAIGLDPDHDGAITWGEVRRRHDAIATYALARLAVSADGRACTGARVEHLVEHHSDGAYAVLHFGLVCPRAPHTLGVHYQLFFDLDPSHRGLVTLQRGAATHTAVFAPDRPRQSFDSSTVHPWRNVPGFWRAGVWHIWAGLDHILFLVTLLLTAVLQRDAHTWRGVAHFRPALRQTVKVVSAFTLAHSLTLIVAATGLAHLPSRWVESAIAASVVAAALDNAYPICGTDRRWLVAFGFGLLHGFGFASALRDPGLTGAALLAALLGFNLGVEAGQLAIAGILVPAAYVIRGSWLYRRAAVLGGSAVIALIAATWFVERALDVRLISS